MSFDGKKGVEQTLALKASKYFFREIAQVTSHSEMIIDDDIKTSRAFFHEIERSYHLWLPYYVPSKILQSPSFAYFIEP